MIALPPTTCVIDGLGPLPVTQPRMVAELGSIVGEAAAGGRAIYPLGGQSMLSIGLPPTRPGIAIDLRGLSQVIDYPARDMTITVQAGITLARLQQLLAAENQRLPIDVPRPEQTTLGGALAVNVSGPRRYGFGTWRDYVIGISAVNDAGREFKAGGRVVKNVAGYDLCKLLVGSLGTLGIITQATLKLRPRPEDRALLTLGCLEDQLDQVLDRLHGSATRPVCLDLLNPAAVRHINQLAGMRLPEGKWAVVVGFEDNGPAVAWQVEQLRKEIGAAWPLEVSTGEATEPLWHALTEFQLLPEATLTFKANLLPHAVAALCRKAAALPEAPLLQAHAGSGIVVGHVRDNLTLDRARALFTVLSDEAVAAQGNLVLLRCPPAWKQSLPVWGRARGDWELMRQVKEQLDPRGLFNPGRFVGGI